MKKLELPRGLFLRGDVIWGPVYVNGVRKRESYEIRVGASVATWNEAVAQASDRLRDVKEGKFVARVAEKERRAAGERGLPTFAAFVAESYLPHLRKQGYSKHYVERTGRQIAEWLTPRFGETRIDSISKKSVMDSTDEISAAFRSQGKTQSTANHHIRRMRAIMNYAIACDLIPHSPCAKVKVPKTAEAANSKARLTADQVDRVLGQLRNPYYRALLAMGFMTLQRIVSCIRLQWKHVQGDTIMFPKNKNGEVVVAVLLPELRAYLDLLPRGKPDAFVFGPLVRPHTVVGYCYSLIRDALITACKRAGIPYGRANAAVTWHTATRASGATLLISRGVAQDHVRRMGGWKTLSAMQRYLGMDESDHRAAAAVLTLKTPAAAPPPQLPKQKRIPKPHPMRTPWLEGQNSTKTAQRKSAPAVTH